MALSPDKFLPQVFQTPANKKLLAATLEQLTSEPEFRRVQGYVGRRYGEGINANDYYVQEPNKTRTDFQLEPSVVFLKQDQQTADDVITYPELLNTVENQGGNSNRPDQLFRAQRYSWDPFIDLDKFSNFSQYYWLPNGPDPVDVQASEIALSDDLQVTDTSTGYEFSGTSGENPDITLVRGGSYEFSVNQDAGFWIQSEPGADGTLDSNPQRSSREVLGAVNNGTRNGKVTFNVPQRSAQNYFTDMTDNLPATLATTLKFNEIDGVFLSDLIEQHNGIDNIVDLDNRTVIFLDQSVSAEQGGWFYRQTFDSVIRTAGATDPDPLDGALGTYDVPGFDLHTEITDQDQRYGVWLISYRYDADGKNPYLSLSPYRTIAKETKLQVQFGSERGNLYYYRDTDGYFKPVPLLTAAKDVLYYQDGASEAKFGRIFLVDQEGQQTLDIDNIIGQTAYTSPNGVVLTNGLKITFRGNTFPASYEGETYYVYGVGDSIEFLPVGNYVTPETYTNNRQDSYDLQSFDSTPFDQALNQPLERDYITVSKQSKDLNPWTRTNRWFHIDVVLASAEYNNTEANLDNLLRAKRPILEFRSGIRLFNFGTASKAPVNIVDDQETDAFSNINGTTSYTIDGYNFINGTRVIFAADEDRDVRNKIYDVTFVDTGATSPVARTFDGDGSSVQFDFGDTSPTANDGLSITSTSQLLVQVDGETFDITEDYTLNLDTQTITFTTAPSDSSLIRLTRLEIINLVPAPDSAVSVDQCVVQLNGVENQGLSYRFDGSNWVNTQQKTSTNQAPLFDVFDHNGISFSDTGIYPSTTFVGNKLFSYGAGTGTEDPNLGFALKYLNINNVGDIVFENSYYTESFVNVVDRESIVTPVANGYVHQYSDRTNYSRLIGWQTMVSDLNTTQIITQTYTQGQQFTIDVVPDQSASVTPVKVIVNNEYVDPSQYSYTTDTNSTMFVFNTEPESGSSVTVAIISSQTSEIGQYSVPANLESNPLNENSAELTLGTIRKHFNSIGRNLQNLEGNVNGRNNIRDLGNVIPFGDKLLQHSAPVPFQGIFSRDKELDLQTAVAYSASEYEKFKTLVVDTYIRNEYPTETVPEILDAVLESIAVGKTENSPFFWTDMIPNGPVTTTTVTVSQITTPIFDLTRGYDFANANYNGVLIYLNGTQLINGRDYVIVNNEPRVTITASLAVDDQLIIHEYDQTYGSYMPSTPTKLGMYPSWQPRMFYDNSYVEEQLVIQGHDGSITTAYGDDRDLLILELEKRIYNNLKTSGAIPLTEADVVPGQFRDTGYSLQEVNKFLSPILLSWTSYNRLDVKTQNYDAGNGFTYNYSQSTGKLDNELQVGNWRGIFNYYYDTDTPHLTPWEMLGITIQPSWWQDQYGAPPYTSGNLVLWKDLAQGLIDEPGNPRVDARYIRPDLLDVIPVDGEGNLLDPLTVLIRNYDFNSFNRPYVVGDQGPVETAWRRSSAYPFALTRLFAAFRPSQFYGLNIDRDLYKFNTEFNQFLVNNRGRFNVSNIVVYGSGVAKHSYLNWVVDYNKQRGINSQQLIENLVNNFDVRLSYRLAAFTDKTYVNFLLEKTSPNSSNSSFLVPDESYAVLLHKNQPIDTVKYSSVIIQRTESGYAVFGNAITEPNFEILVSRVDGNYKTVSVGDTTVRLNQTYTPNISLVPYGYEFKSVAGVADFLYSYGRRLELAGFVFDDTVNGVELNWDQMVTEFLSWVQQGWETTAAININPGAKQLRITRDLQEANNVFAMPNALLDVNQLQVSNRSTVIDRLDNTITIRVLDDTLIGFLNLEFTNTEHCVVFDNSTVFNDLLYQPISGDRQSRISLNGQVSANWNGRLDVPGFFLNEDNILEWQENRRYSKGEIVLFKNKYWSAAQVIEPSATFQFSKWIQSDYSRIATGLLPNLATRGRELAEYYDNKQVVLGRDADLLATGLIGFRPRSYMTDINLNDVTQVGVYSTFIQNKGTPTAAEAFRQADLVKEQAEYRVYENWALKKAAYGASDNRRYFEIQLDPDLLTTNPSVITISQPGDAVESNQNVLLRNLYKTSKKYANVNILPTTFATLRGFPTAGYVNNEDIDIQVFDNDNLTNINPREISAGTVIWLAKKNSYDWTVYRATRSSAIPVRIDDTLRGSIRITFDKDHGLIKNDVFCLKLFQSNLNAVYRIEQVNSPRDVLVEGSVPGSESTITGSGVILKLDTVRVDQPSDISELPFVQNLVSGDRIWVDNDINGRWQTIQKNQPYTGLDDTLTSDLPSVDQQYGHSVAQSVDTIYSLVGAPGYSSTGSVWNYGFTEQGFYSRSEIVNLAEYANNANFSQLGFSTKIGQDEWAVSGAPDQGGTGGVALVLRKADNETEYSAHQLLTPPSHTADNHEFGYSVTMSRNSNWIYVGAPGRNTVYAYQLIELESQSVSYTGDGTTTEYSFKNAIVVDQDTEIEVQLGDNIIAYTDYTVDLANQLLTFDTAPSDDTAITIRRRTVTTDEGDGSSVSFDLQGRADKRDIFTATTAASVRIDVDGEIQQAGVDYTMAVSGTVVFATAPIDGAEITYTAISYYEPMSSGITVAGLDSTARFGHSVTTTTDGRQVMIGAPGSSGADADEGTVYLFDRSAFNTVIQSDSTSTIDFLNTLDGTASVYLNNIRQRDADLYTNGTYEIVGGNSVRFLSEVNQGPFYVDGTSNSGFTAGEVGLFYPLYLLESAAESADQGTNTELGPGAHAHTFAEYPGTTFYMPNSDMNHGESFVPSTIPPYQDSVSGEIRVGLDTGDVVAIETNQFNLVQTVIADNPTAQARFGFSVDQCPTNCSLYIGAPQNSTQGPDTGSVERWVNQARAYGVITSAQTVTSVTPGNSVRINDINVEFTGSTLASVIDDINGTVGLSNVQASAVDNKLRISVINTLAVAEQDQIRVCPGLSNPADTGLSELFLAPMSHTQTIYSPQPTDFGYFGQVVDIDTNADSLVVSATNNDLTAPSTWVNDDTTFDSKTTRFIDLTSRCGAVFTFDYLPSYQRSVDNPGKFLFGQLIYTNSLAPADQFGFSVNQTSGRLMVGALGTDDFSTADIGSVYVFDNSTRSPAWAVERQQKAAVETDLLNSVFLYDRRSKTELIYLDWVDPQRGKILGAAAENINYNGSVDPAFYTAGSVHNVGKPWRQEHLGEIWWNTENVRFIDYDQGSPIYASRTAGTVFPGSSVDIYQWTSSKVPPSQYSGPGLPYSVSSYSTSATLNDSGTFETVYYFWVTGLNTVARSRDKKLSTNAVAQYILDPRSSGISYITALRNNALALYNVEQYLGSGDTVLHVEYDETKNDSPVHVEYDLFQENKPDQFIDDRLFRKFLDSYSGADTDGNRVPDPDLRDADKYGIQFRPRQSMFEDRLVALKNYIQFANRVLQSVPVVESKTFNKLFSAEPIPEKTDTNKSWNKQVADLTELGYQDINSESVGYRYLVLNDSDNRNRWTIYEITLIEGTSTRELSLKAVQTYDTTEFWNYVNWYATGYSNSTVAYKEVENVADLSSLRVIPGTVIKVKDNSQGQWELYNYSQNNAWTRVGVQNGTIQISDSVFDYAIGKFGFDSEVFDAQYFDQEPIVETRRIIESINEELFINDLVANRNEAVTLTFKYVLSEQIAPDWLYKTSLIDVDHSLRVLQPFQIYKPDNQDFVRDYINEVKPYRTKIRDFNLTYAGEDQFSGDITDFDLPAYFNNAQNKFTSPILDNESRYESSLPDSSEVWQSFPYNQWYGTYLLALSSIEIVAGGTGYTVEPEVTVSGNADVPAVARARINAIGNVISVEIVSPGSGYTETPTVTFSGGNGTGAQARPIMQVNNVRTLSTVMKFDRYEYTTSIIGWQADIAYNNGVLVRYLNKVYTADALILIRIADTNGVVTVTELKSSGINNYQVVVDVPLGDISTTTVTRNGTVLTEGVDYTVSFETLLQSVFTFTESAIDNSPSGRSTFEPNDWTLTDAATLSGVDRTMGLYDPDLEDAGLQLSQLISGVEYPGVQVYGPGWELVDPTSGYDIDVAYSSNYSDTYLGTNLDDINVDGGDYIDTYHSHAPEELVPGSMFDTLIMLVSSTPGADYLDRGHAWPVDHKVYEITSGNQTLDWGSNSVEVPYNIVVRNLKSGQTLYEDTYYTVDYINHTIDLFAGAGSGSFVVVDIYGLGGGNQLDRTSVVGSDIVDNTVNMPVSFDQVRDAVIFINGEEITDFALAEANNGTLDIVFDQVYGSTDYVAITVMGNQTPYYEYSSMAPQRFVIDGSSRQFDLDANRQGPTYQNMLVEVDGTRLRPPTGIEYIGDASTTSFDTDPNSETPGNGITDNQIQVYVDYVPLTLGVDFTVLPNDGSSIPRTVVVTTTPAAGSVVQIYVNTDSDYSLTGNLLVIDDNVNLEDSQEIAVYTYQDSRQLKMLTKVFIGPTETDSPAVARFDEFPFDSTSFDGQAAVASTTLEFDLGRTGVTTDAVWVTVNGSYITPGDEFTVTAGIDTSFLTLSVPAIDTDDVIAVTMYTDNRVQDSIQFRLFDDMRDNRSLLRVLPTTQTLLTQDLATDATVIYVENANNLPGADPANGEFGILLINGERITYREIDFVNNTVTGLRRGTAGTGVFNHSAGSVVYDATPSQRLQSEYQDQYQSATLSADTSTLEYTATGVSAASADEVEVYVGGITVSQGYTVDLLDPVTITFDEPVVDGLDILIRVRKSQSLYAPGSDLPLQLQTTGGARFIRGL